MGVGRWTRDARYSEFVRPQDARHFKFVRPSFFSARPRTPRHQNFGVPALNFGVRDAGTHLNGNAALVVTSSGRGCSQGG
jgi:hypothetical protein